MIQNKIYFLHKTKSFRSLAQRFANETNDPVKEKKILAEKAKLNDITPKIVDLANKYKANPNNSQVKSELSEKIKEALEISDQLFHLTKSERNVKQLLEDLKEDVEYDLAPQATQDIQELSQASKRRQVQSTFLISKNWLFKLFLFCRF